MAIKTDDCDIRDVRFFMEYGGNSDLYLNLIEMNKKTFNRKGEPVELNVLTNMRVSTSGSKIPHEVIMAIANLFKVMEAHGLNKHPFDE